MSIKLEDEIVKLLEDEKTIKALATLDENGDPYTVIKKTIYPYEDNKIIYLELLESSITGNNLLRSIWFNKNVSLSLENENGDSCQIKGKVIKSIIAGRVFQKYYRVIRQKLGDVDLSAVWVIEPMAATNETFSRLKEQEEVQRPYFKHLDRIAKNK